MSDKTPQNGNIDEPAAGTEDALFAVFQRKLGRDALRYLPSVVVPAALGFVGTAIFTRVFETGVYGEFTLAVSLATILVPILGGWLKQSTLRYLPRYQADGRADEYLGKLNTLVLATAALIVVLAAIGYPFSRSSRFYFPTAALMVVWLFFLAYSGAFQAHLRSAVFTRYQVALAVGRLVFSVALVFWVSRDVMSLVWGLILAYLVIIAPMAKDLGLLRPGSAVRRLDRTFVKTLAAYGIPVVGWTVASRLLDLSDRFVIAALRGTGEVGIYGANYNLTLAFMGFVAQPFLLAADALVMNAWERGVRDRIQEIISNFTRYFLLAAVPVAAYLGAYAHRIAEIIFGEAFREGYVIMPMVAAGIIVWHLGFYGHKGMKLAEKTGVIFILITICAAVNILLNLIFVPMYGYVGAAVTTLVSYTLYPIMVFYISKRYIAWRVPWRSTGNIVLAAAAAAVVWAAFDRVVGDHLPVLLDLALGGIAGGIVYVLGLLILREPTEKERKMLGDGMRRLIGRRAP